MKNIAGNEVSIFLFRFELRGKGIDFVLNEAIAADMYPDIDEKTKPLIHACCEGCDIHFMTAKRNRWTFSLYFEIEA